MLKTQVILKTVEVMKKDNKKSYSVYFGKCYGSNYPEVNLLDHGSHLKQALSGQEYDYLLSIGCEPKHLHIVDNLSHIEIGDYYFYSGNRSVMKADFPYDRTLTYSWESGRYFKIVATTDANLGLPMINKETIKKACFRLDEYQGIDRYDHLIEKFKWKLTRSVNNVFAIELPEEVINVTVRQNSEQSDIWYESDGKSYSKPLPKGKWFYGGLINDVTNDTWSKITNRDADQKFLTPKSSGIDMLRFSDILFENPLGARPRWDELSPSEYPHDYLDTLDEWDKFEKMVYDINITHLFYSE